MEYIVCYVLNYFDRRMNVYFAFEYNLYAYLTFVE